MVSRQQLSQSQSKHRTAVQRRSTQPSNYEPRPAVASGKAGEKYTNCHHRQMSTRIGRAGRLACAICYGKTPFRYSSASEPHNADHEGLSTLFRTTLERVRYTLKAPFTIRSIRNSQPTTAAAFTDYDCGGYKYCTARDNSGAL